MVTVRCSRCGKRWTGRDEYEAEAKMSRQPCGCEKELRNMSREELEAMLKKSGGMK